MTKRCICLSLYILLAVEHAAASAGGETDEILARVRAGVQLRDAGRLAEAEKVLQSAVDRAMATDPNSRTAADAANELGFVYQDLGRSRDAERYYQIALRIAERHGDRAGTLVIINNLATMYIEAGFYDRVERLKIAERVSQMGSGPEVAHAKSTLAYLSMRKGKFDQAEALFIEALSAFEAAGQDEDAAIARGNLGMVVAWRGRSSAGINMLEESVAFLERNSARPVFLKALANLSVFYAYLGRHAEAKIAAQHAANGAVGVLGKESLATVAILMKCSYAMTTAKNKTEAKRYRREAEQIRRGLHADWQVDVSDLMPDAPKSRR